MERNGLYSLLAAVFRDAPGKDLLGHLLDPALQRDLAAAGLDAESISSLEPGAVSQETLSIEFSHLFVGPGKHVSPHESVQLGRGGTLWGPETVAVKRFIEGAGFAYEGGYHGLPDHISVELEFLAQLASLEAAAWQAGDEEQASNCRRFQREFLDRHLGRWVAPFSERVGKMARLPFYAGMANLTRDFVAAERA
jgi:TorA maturation chaperone TorD